MLPQSVIHGMGAVVLPWWVGGGWIGQGSPNGFIFGNRTKQSLGLRHHLKPCYSGSDPDAAHSLDPPSLSFLVWWWLGARAGLVGWEPLWADSSRSLLGAGCCGGAVAAGAGALACSVAHVLARSFFQGMSPALVPRRWGKFKSALTFWWPPWGNKSRKRRQGSMSFWDPWEGVSSSLGLSGGLQGAVHEGRWYSLSLQTLSAPDTDMGAPSYSPSSWPPKPPRPCCQPRCEQEMLC